jgi:hypothetical protein
MQQVSTRAATKIAGITPASWRQSINRGDFPCAPAVREGQRMWAPDDLLVLCWHSALIKSGMRRPMAGGLAGLLRKAIAADPDAETLSVYTWSERTKGHLAVGRTPPVEDAVRIMDIPVVHWRRNVADAIARVRKHGRS